MMKRKVFLTFPQNLINEPIIYDIGKKFAVVTNIRGASVSDEIALVALQLEGEPEEVDRALAYMVERGVKVESLETPDDV